ncbi:polysaccharide pyruvyl transferase family protein [Runella aurantiaca]|uniref:Polysaccharide pyruvyl transferase family protein n=1 Tax=Runella aurantiaca TaxID=2282308 RepID=A0A369I6R3_9BACT|nr:polysaccharide pyruvyl transferase family protein [Runella aurantiaca]RDB04732.1 polysaccharide pyruvyl transferase family protein [Runella aurantiaca]
MKIGIWGLYDKGNFGDDLMAILFVNYLISEGFEVTAYNLSDNLASEISCSSIKSIDYFVDYNDVIVIGGGGMLVNNSFLKFALKESEFKFEMSFMHLFNSLRKYNKKIIPISIGGANSIKLNNPYKNKIFSTQYTLNGSVRLPSDLLLVENSIFEYFPDIVLSTSIFFKPINVVSAKKKKKIVLNLKNKTARPLIDSFIKNDIFDIFDVYTFKSHAAPLSHIGNYEFEISGKNFDFNKIHEGVDFLKDADFVISSKLHVGVAAASFGAFFISYKGPSKAKEFLKNSNNENYIIDDVNSLSNLLSSFDSKKNNSFLIDNQRDDSLKHFAFLLNTLNKL